MVIGKQIWIQENLRVTKYRNGDAIENVTDNMEWSTLSTGAWCYYDNDAQYNEPYGKLYNGYAINDTRMICPEGWHVPTDDDWNSLEDLFSGGELKEAGTTHWVNPNVGATNSSGFTALPGGLRYGSNGAFLFNGIGTMGFYGYWWTASDSDFEDIWIRNLEYNLEGSISSSSSEGFTQYGFSCRCIKD